MESKCDVVILSNAYLKHLRNFTRLAIRSLVRSEPAGTFNVIVCEQTTWQYNHATTLHMPGAFNYNRFANTGASQGKAEWICISNNDVEFTPGWFSKLTEHGGDVLSPRSPGMKMQDMHKSVARGYNIMEHFSGWCFVIRRQVWENIGRFNEDFPFYSADCMVVRQLREAGYLPAMVPQSVVTHFLGKTRKTLPFDIRKIITEGENQRYHQQYGPSKDTRQCVS